MAPTYNYQCEAEEDHLVSVVHKMSESPKVHCPFCGSKCHKTLKDACPEMWIRGQGIVSDKAGAKRDMNIWELKNKDPYDYMRQPGEKDYLIDKLEKAGKRKIGLSKEQLKKIEKARQDAMKLDYYKVCIECNRTLPTSRFIDEEEDIELNICNDCRNKS